MSDSIIAAPIPGSNMPEFTVSEISQAVKHTLEGNFERIRVRGEVSKPNYHSSGHLYFSLKDEGAVIDAVCWRGTVGRLRFRLEHGDIAVWGGPSRLFFHGVAPLADGDHPVMGPQRLNLTFRKIR